MSLILRQNKYLLIFFILGLTVFAIGLFNDFIWLDKRYIVYNTNLVPFNFTKIFTFSGFTGEGYYRPITASYYSLLLTLFGEHAFAFKLLQYFIHFINTSLVFIFFRKLMREKIAFVLSLIFLIHPMNAVNVTFISAAAGPLFILFGLTALIVSRKNDLNVYVRATIIFFLILFSALSKEEGLIFILLVPCFNFLYGKKNFLLTLVPTVLAACAYFLLRFGFAGIKYEKLELVPIMQLSFVERLFNIPAVINYYMKTFILPVKLATNQQWTIAAPSFTGFYLPLILIILASVTILSVIIYFKKKHPGKLPLLMFFLIWFALTLSLYLHLIPLDYTVSNRWFALPMIGFLGMVGVTLSNLKITFPHKYILLAVILIVILLSIRTSLRVNNWKDEVTLFNHDSEITTNFSTEANLGLALYQKQMYEDALPHLTKSVDMFAYDVNLILLAQDYEKLNDLDNAEKYYLLAAQTNSFGPEYHDRMIYRLIAKFLIEHDNAAAGEVINAGLKVYPDSYRLLALKAINEYRLGHKNTAILNAVQALKVNKNELTSGLITDIVLQRDIVIDEKYIQNIN